MSCAQVSGRCTCLFAQGHRVVHGGHLKSSPPALALDRGTVRRQRKKKFITTGCLLGIRYSVPRPGCACALFLYNLTASSSPFGFLASEVWTRDFRLDLIHSNRQQYCPLFALKRTSWYQQVNYDYALPLICPVTAEQIWKATYRSQQEPARVPGQR
jgi:hypothetical protein